jgi:catechol 2,3-dioxygenase-like lactoylglutathione lyase family enzyme
VKPTAASGSSGRGEPALAQRFGRLHQVALKATDLEASIAFYRDLLGLPFIDRFEPPGLAFFDLDGTRLMLSPTSSEGTLYFAVGSLVAIVADLEARGVTFMQPPALVHRDETGTFGCKGGEEWMAFLRDPSGNLIGLAERRRARK